MKKIQQEYIIDQYESGVRSYTDFTVEVGLWDSEKYVFEKYLKPTDRILDLGCGTGRTTFALYQQGYQQIQGLDLTPGMIKSARELNHRFDTQIEFTIGDARQLDLPDAAFDAVIFSFNGLMSIPEYQNRAQVLAEIYRVLQPGGNFIFTTHDREKDEQFFEFWREQRVLWEAGKQDLRLYEFGDIIAGSKNEERLIYIHIPDRSEVRMLFSEAGFTEVETFYRSDLFAEPESVLKRSGECRFWVVQKG